MKKKNLFYLVATEKKIIFLSFCRLNNYYHSYHERRLIVSRMMA